MGSRLIRIWITERRVKRKGKQAAQPRKIDLVYDFRAMVLVIEVDGDVSEASPEK